MVDELEPKPRYVWKPIVATATKVGDVKGESVLKINVPIEEDAKIMVDAAKRIDREDREDREKKERDERERDKKERDEREKREIMVTEENKKLKREKEELEKRLADERERDRKDVEAKSHSNKITTGTTSISTSGSASFGIVDDSVKTLDKNKNLVYKKGDRKMEDYEIEQKVDSLVNKKLSQMDIQKTIKDIGISSAQTEKKVMAIEDSLEGINETLKGLMVHEKDIEKNIQDGLIGRIGEAKNDIDKYGRESVEKIDHVHQKIESLEKKLPENVICSGEKGCNAEIPVGSSNCPNCARPIDKWPDMPDWVPYSERKK